jgi:nickel-dependent lactate racemase
MRVELAYGHTGIELELPDNASVTLIEPNYVPGLPDEQGSILSALQAPLGTPSLRELAQPADTVAIVFSDLTRPMPNERVLPPLLIELEAAGVPDDQIVLVNGLGTHRPQTTAELRGMLGDELVQRYQIVQHDAQDQKNLVEVVPNRVGRMVRVNRAYMEASVRILTGFIEPHLFAGFSGGPKGVLPAIADLDAILDNHSPAMLAERNATWSQTTGNPAWEEMLSIAQSTKPDLILNVALNRDRQITGVFAGDLVQAHRRGVAFVQRTAMQPVPHLYDIVITSNSGHPLDLNLYQAVKGMSAAAQIVRPGGVIILAASCWDGIPDHGEYRRLLWEADSVEALLERMMSPGFRCRDQWQAQIQAQIQTKAHVHVRADGLSDEELRKALVIPCRSIEDTVDELRNQNPGATIAVLPDGPQTVPYLANERAGMHTRS